MDSRIWNGHRSELVQRLLAEVCELCGSTDKIEVHHIRALKDLNSKGRKQPPDWVTRMASRRRKTLVICRVCHEDIHARCPTRRPR
ncbi:HNH endonuclease [Nonomuraea sp. NBC_00507]|uniref:HNH endonuclease n=1 Tax=Nonomuraea sp. NBC_00507 TaxID=2976002 RepID=UPI003FA5E3DB